MTIATQRFPVKIHACRVKRTLRIILKLKPALMRVWDLLKLNINRQLFADALTGNDKKSAHSGRLRITEAAILLTHKTLRRDGVRAVSINSLVKEPGHR